MHLYCIHTLHYYLTHASSLRQSGQ